MIHQLEHICNIWSSNCNQINMIAPKLLHLSGDGWHTRAVLSDRKSIWQAWQSDDTVKWSDPCHVQAQLDPSVLSARSQPSSATYEPYGDVYMSMVAHILRESSYYKIAGLLPNAEVMEGPDEDFRARVQRASGMIPGFDDNSGWADDWQKLQPTGHLPLLQWPMISHR
jgi:hypothetical protein